MKTLLVPLVCALLGFGCELTAGEEAPALDQTYLFEIEYINHAWGRFWYGTYVDNQGRVYRYALGSEDAWRPVRGDAFTEAELRRKYSHGDSLLGTVTLSTLRDRAAMIPAAADGALSEPVYPCRDAGTITFRTFLYDADARLYRPVLLYQAGDEARQNRARSARLLTGWLQTLDDRFTDADAFCAP